jgi:hypothetical protein
LAKLANFVFDWSKDLSLIIEGSAFIMLLFATHWFFLNTISWKISDWYVTTERVIVFGNKPFIRTDTRYINLFEIHDIEMSKTGFLQNMLDYGQVTLNIPAVPEPIIYDLMPKPEKLINLIEIIQKKTEISESNKQKMQKKLGSGYIFLNEKNNDKTT